MALRTIRLSNDELLRKKSKPVKDINENIKTLLDDMKETMDAANGMGIAAPQVGVLKRVVIISLQDVFLELINPEMLEAEGAQTRHEGCLSVPGRRGIVERPARVKVKALNRDGEEIVVEGEELLAVVLCHELDHLDGVLYTDKASELYDTTREDDEDEEEEDQE